MSSIYSESGSLPRGTGPLNYSPRLATRSRKDLPDQSYFDSDSLTRYYTNKSKAYPNLASGTISGSLTPPPQRRERHPAETRRRRKTAGDLASKFAESTTLQGVGFIGKANKWYSKAFWILVFCFAMAATCYQTYHVFVKYYSFQTTSSVGVGYDKLPYPSITICNINPIRKSKVKEYGGQLEELMETVNPKKSYGTDWMKKWNNDNYDDFYDMEGFGDIGDMGEFGGMDDFSARKKREVICDPTIDDCEVRSRSKRSKSAMMMPCLPGDPRCNPLMSPCEEDDDDCRDMFPSLFHEDLDFFTGMVNFTSKYEKFESEFNQQQSSAGGGDDGQNSDQDGGGEVSWTLKLREQFKDVMSSYTRDQRADLGHQAHTMILNCEFNGRKCYYWDAVQHLTGDYGNCFTFNSAFARDRPIIARQSGTSYGLSLVLFTETDEYIPGLTQGHGMRVVIHPFNTMPFVAENGLSVMPGTETYIGMRMLNLTRLGEPYGKCDDDGEFSRTFGYNYTIEGCINTCLPRAIYSRCGCYMNTEPELYNPVWANHSEPCQSDDQLKCMYQLRFKDEDGELDCKCNQACRTLAYDIEISHNTWPDSSFWYALVDAICERNEVACQKIMKEGGNSEEQRKKVLQSNFLYLHVYYRDLNFERIEEKPDYETEQFLSDFGGTIGLWVGASFITGVEVFYFIIQLLSHCCRRS